MNTEQIQRSLEIDPMEQLKDLAQRLHDAEEHWLKRKPDSSFAIGRKTALRDILNAIENLQKYSTT